MGPPDVASLGKVFGGGGGGTYKCVAGKPSVATGVTRLYCTLILTRPLFTYKVAP